MISAFDHDSKDEPLHLVHEGERRSMTFLLTALLLGWVISVVLVIAAVWQVQEEEALEELAADATVMAGSISQRLQQYSGIADAVSNLRTLKTVLGAPVPAGLDKLNRFLQQTNRSLGSDTLFVLGLDGEVIGASNYGTENSSVGHNFAFRPYFQQAALGESVSYYAVGMITKGRGYYFAAPIRREGKVLGVVVVHVLLESVFERLAAGQNDFLLVGYDSIIFASSNPDWQMRSLQRLPEAQREAIRQSRRYGDYSLSPIANHSDRTPDVFNDTYVQLASGGVVQRYLVGRALVRQAGWHVFALMPRVALLQRILQFCVYYTLVYGLLVLFWLYWRKRTEVQRHVNSMNMELERRVSSLTSELTESNTELQQLVAHYQRTQSELEATQDQLIQTAKLAVLGELSAGINHELNQPLLALQTYAENSQKLLARERFGLVADNLHEILQITDSMHAIVSRFKVFARRSPPDPRLVDVNEIISAALMIMKPLLRKAGVGIGVELPPNGQMILCEPVQIQQVLINLLTNASEAMEGIDDARVLVRVEDCDGQIRILVIDNGPGIAKELQSKIFQPFFTTKSKGLGIGLALSRRILETLSGSLVAESDTHGGTVFVMTLRKHKGVDE
ncbi:MULTISPECIES: ATP-binding protein [unclassified Oceanobacter]|jgi:two-component system C4-dicarboxylate transport sensor histidine kinase DctB|uniref:ATP-binding protein n=1 Tax=unclassified Oceanobacter TaxID=2620260 RepID=UPI002733D5A7|nr:MULTISPECIES: ATP-binding protein [unclassified Oceanobacter]MDP2504110.1 ATP-binding protein [Oceanobacter sp. 3_MG-2023]MDP2546550.1 ATP-binding protein [Oceanobacter sp. 4_MG-2023]MDP2610302.1 ATP-binding protein [Oceanobacter sp. 1_MG-2023]MDP2613560.1 ATP-binding protein [Oceanobacter sp. 2_MG-2023]